LAPGAACVAVKLPVDAAMHSPLIEFEYRLQRDTLGALRWGAWGAAMLAVVLLLAAGAAHLHVTDSQLAMMRSQLDQVREQAVAAAASAPPGEPPAARDFTAALPDTPPVAEVVQRLSRACADAGVALAGVQAAHRPATVAQLGRTELTVLVRGPYPGARTALDAVLQRYPSLTLQRLRMRRTSSPTDLETSATLSVWGRPVSGDPVTPAGKAS
jgi:hypothetical protein